ncbi:hypothetical protein EJB05_16061, partial [Eragrostis curvula]
MRPPSPSPSSRVAAAAVLASPQGLEAGTELLAPPIAHHLRLHRRFEHGVRQTYPRLQFVHLGDFCDAEIYRFELQLQSGLRSHLHHAGTWSSSRFPSRAYYQQRSGSRFWSVNLEQYSCNRFKDDVMRYIVEVLSRA